MIKEKKMFSSCMQLVGHRGEVYSARFSHNGELLATSGYDRNIFIWDIYDPEVKNYIILRAHANTILSLCWSMDDSKVITSSADRAVSTWDITSGTRIHKYTAHKSVVNCVDSNKRGLVLSASDDCTARIWDEASTNPINVIELKSQITSCCFDKESRQVFLGCVDDSIHVWNLIKNEEEYILSGHADTVTGIAISNSGKLLLSNSMDNSLKIWDVSPFSVGNTRERSTLYGATHNFECNLLRCCWSADDEFISCGSCDRYNDK
jgi:Prp8 binding protein